MMALHSVRGLGSPGADEGVDVDEDVGFFKMSPASAEQVTLQIRSMMERAWEYVAIAYQGRAHIALGYATWDEYVDDRLSDLRLTVPREERGAVVQSLSRAQLSLRAIAKVLGVDVATVHRALGANNPTDPANRDDAGEPAPIRGRDGKSYPRRRRPTAIACSICGEIHEAEPDQCPWDLFASGIGPRPVPVGSSQGDDEVAPPAPECDSVAETSDVTRSIADAMARASCLLDELGSLPDLVHEIEDLGRSQVVPEREERLVHQVRAFLRDLREQSAALPGLVRRLERAAHQMVVGRP